VVCLLLSSSAAGIVVCNAPASHEVRPQSQFDMVGYLDSAGGTTGVLIDPYRVLTTAHAVEDISGKTFTLSTVDGVQVYYLTSKMVHPSVDLVIVTLDRSTGLSGYELYTGGAEAGKVGVLVGYGLSGTGAPDAAAYPKGTKRVGYNKINSATSTMFYYSFDRPTSSNSLGADKEAITAFGDSGGPTFIEEDGVLKLAGIHYAVSNYQNKSAYPTYGDFGYDVRVGAYASWIFQQAPEPATLTLLSVGVGALVFRRPRK
jgi:hypothetical protein